MSAWSDDQGRLGDRVATLQPLELHRAIAHAAAVAIRTGVPAELLDARIAVRNGQLIGVGPNRSLSRLAHLDTQIADAHRRADNARRNANLTDDPDLAAQLLVDAAQARRDVERFHSERNQLGTARDALGDTFDSDADYLAHALAKLATVEHQTTGAVADALAQILEITAMTVSDDHHHVDVEFFVLVPADSKTARLGPITCRVINRAYRNTLPGTMPAHLARHGLVAAAIAHGLTDRLRHRNERALLRLLADALVDHGYTRLAAKIATTAAVPSLHAVIAHDLWDDPLPDDLDAAYVNHVLATYRNPAFAWNPRTHTLDPTDRQAFVDTVVAYGGRLDSSQFVATLGRRGAQVVRVYSRPQQCGSTPPWQPCLRRGGNWTQGRLTGDDERYLELEPCPHCSGHATIVSRTPETPASLLCPDCCRMPTPGSPVFPDEYLVR